MLLVDQYQGYQANTYIDCPHICLFILAIALIVTGFNQYVVPDESAYFYPNIRFGDAREPHSISVDEVTRSYRLIWQA